MSSIKKFITSSISSKGYPVIPCVFFVALAVILLFIFMPHGSNAPVLAGFISSGNTDVSAAINTSSLSSFVSIEPTLNNSAASMVSGSIISAASATYAGVSGVPSTASMFSITTSHGTSQASDTAIGGMTSSTASKATSSSTASKATGSSTASKATSSKSPAPSSSPASNDPRYAPITTYNQYSYGSISGVTTAYVTKGDYTKDDATIDDGKPESYYLSQKESPDCIGLNVDIKNHTLTVYIGASGEQKYEGDNLYLSLVTGSGKTVFNNSIATITNTSNVVQYTIPLITYLAGSAGTWLIPETYTLKIWTQHDQMNHGTFPVDERGLEK